MATPAFSRKPSCFLTTLLLLLAPGLSSSHPVQAATSLPAYAASGKIMHAGGGMEGTYAYTNSKEALTQSLARKVSSVELDFMYTSDGVLVCNHGWKDFGKKAPTWKQYKKQGTIGGYTPMKAKTALKLLAKAKKTWLVVDTMEADPLKVYQELITLCQENGWASYLKKVVPQIYKKSQYAKIKRMYAFPQWIFTLYKLKMKTLDDYKAIGSFCKKNGIQTVTLAEARINEFTTTTLHKYGVFVATHTINSLDDHNTMKSYGVDFIYTDHLY